MTEEETEGLVGAEPPPALDLHVVTDAPCIAPEQDGGAAATARAHDALAGAEFAPLDLAELLTLDIPERGMVLDPIIPEKGLALLYAMRGTGKTHVALGIAHAVATGARFLNWQAPTPRRVLLVDGEMPTSDLRGPLAQRRGRHRRGGGTGHAEGAGRRSAPTTASAIWRRPGGAAKARALPRRRRAPHPRQPGEPAGRAA